MTICRNAGSKRDHHLRLFVIRSQISSATFWKLPQPDVTSGSQNKIRAAQRQICSVSDHLPSEEHLSGNHLKMSGRGSLDGTFPPRGSFFTLRLMKWWNWEISNYPKPNRKRALFTWKCACLSMYNAAEAGTFTSLSLEPPCTERTQADVSFTHNRKRQEKLDSYLQEKLDGIAPCDGMAFLIHTFTHGSWPASPGFTKIDHEAQRADRHHWT